MRYKEPLKDRNVLSVARDRLHHIFDTHDSPVVLFSGGKDSQVLMHLVKDVATERGIDFVNAMFMHDEFTLKPILDTVRHYASMPWVRMHHLVIPEPGLRYVFDRPIEFKHWDKNKRKMMMPIPEYSIRPTEEDWEKNWWLHEKSAFQCQFFPGKVALINGIRSQESPYRWLSTVTKLNENYVNILPDYKRATFCRPIFDWGEKDVFKYIKEKQIQYCQAYDWHMFAKMRLRMSPFLHPDNIRNLKKLRQLDPSFYERLLEIFPDQVVHDRYGEDKSDKKMLKKYGHSWDGIYNYIMEHYEEGKAKNLALNRYESIKAYASSPRTVAFNSMPLDYVLRYFVGGRIWKMLIPKCHSTD